ncbi:hypothetical protein ACIBJE_16670 [Micromonospora sp. NPDC050187]|uniref:hypothetical protein n=1 Tax=Micromonospora sp. NPDC050187 TaxID=3364277 RepID=UPI00378F0CEB
MKVDSNAEAVMRTAIHAAVKRDFTELDKRLSGFEGDAAVQATLELTLTVIGFLMIDIHGARPTEAQVSAVARQVADAESWASPTSEEVEAFLGRLMQGEPLAPAVPVENILVLSFVVAANLLSSCRRDDEKWWDYLDRVEDAIEATR